MGSEFRPKVGRSQPKTKFQIFISPRNGGGQFAPTLDNFYQTLKAVTCKCQLSGVNPLRWHTAATLAKNVRRRGSSGQTGSRNMAATHFLDSATPTSYSTPNTLGGLSRTVTELPRGAVTIAPLLRPSATRNILSPDGDGANFERGPPKGVNPPKCIKRAPPPTFDPHYSNFT